MDLKRLPQGAIQPQTAVDPAGTIHLVYFKGDPAAGDLFYARSRDGNDFSSPIRVNSRPGSAIAVGNIRGARVAVGKSGIVFVVWNGSQVAAQANRDKSPMLFTRLLPQSRQFEPERNLIHTAYGLDGGGGIAADRAGHVYVFWHAPPPGMQGEQFRSVWMTRSSDDGATFEPERRIWMEPTGACGCCSLAAFADANGRVYVLFRSAREVLHRDMYLLMSEDGGHTFTGSDVSPWKIGSCVMSAEAFVGAADRVYAAWETEKQVHFGAISGSRPELLFTQLPNPGPNQKYPALAATRDGHLLVAWTEQMAWKRGGSLHWQLYSAAGKPIGDEGEAAGVPAWSLVSAYARPNGRSFVIWY